MFISLETAIPLVIGVNRNLGGVFAAYCEVIWVGRNLGICKVYEGDRDFTVCQGEKNIA